MVPFNGQAQTITLLSPNGGEVWSYGTTEVISWSGENLGNIARVDFSPDGGNSWYYFGEVPTAPGGGNASMGVPSFPTQSALIRISDVSQPQVTDQSDAAFTINIPPISIYEPGNSSVAFVNDAAYVYWQLNIQGISLLNAEISLDNGETFSPIAQNINALISYTYLVLSDVSSDSCILKLINAENPEQFGISAVFTINPKPVYTITSPSGGEFINALSPFTISWNVENPYSNYCYLEYSINNGANWEIIDNGVSNGLSGSYDWFTPNINADQCLIRITDSYSLTSSDTSGVFSIFPFPETPVCMVTVDSLTNSNVIIWEKPDSDLIADFLVYKETDEANVYIVIDTVGYNELPVVNDYDSNPTIRPYRYKIGFKDTENRLFPAGDYHQTIHLTINQGVNGNWNLIWTPYTGFDYTSYRIMRRAGDGAFEQIATVSSSFNSYTDLDAPSGDIAYMIKIVNPDGCNTGLRNAVYTDVYSNQASASVVSVADIRKAVLGVYPNPASDILYIQPGGAIEGNISLTISDLTGRVVYSYNTGDVPAGQLISVSTAGLAEGVYLMNLNSEEVSIARKIVIRH